MNAATMLRVAVFGVVAAALLWSMTLGDDTPTSAPPPPTPAAQTPAPVPSSTSSPAPSPTPESVASAAPVDVDERRAARLAHAEEALRAFARPAPGRPQQLWWDGLRPWLAEEAIEDFRYIDAQRVGFTRVAGRGRAVPTAAPETLLTLVRIPTDTGDYAVELEDAEDGLGVTAIYPWQDRDES